MAAKSRAAFHDERSSLVAGYVEALVLDYLAAETRRSVAVLSNDSKVLRSGSRERRCLRRATGPAKVWTSSSVSSSE